MECKDRADYSKGNELHYRTVKAIYEKWINNGIAHKSNISEESYYRNINTKYVTLIRNLVLDIIPSDLEIYDFIEMFGYEIKSKIKIMPSKRDNEEFKRSIGKYLSRLIGYDAYINGFQNCKEYRKYSYRFYDMIQYVQINYFRGKTLEINDKFLELSLIHI